MNTYTKEQREAWDKIKGPGLYTVDGDAAYEYLCSLIKWLLFDREELKTILLIGSDEQRERFLTHMGELNVIEYPKWEPEFFGFSDRYDEVSDTSYPVGVNTQDDVEQHCDFIRHAQTNKYNRVAAVVILNEEACGIKHINQLLKIPVWRGSNIEKHIELPVYNVNDAAYTNFCKASQTTTPSGVKQTLQLIRADEVEEEGIGWLVPEFIPLNAPTVFSGQMDSLKSTTAIDIAAALSTWRPWFMGDIIKDEYGIVEHHQPAITLFAGSEDKFESTVVPRYKAAGGNPSLLYNLNLEIRCEKETPDGVQTWEVPLSLDEHVELLRERIRHLNSTREWKVALLICDPLITLFGNKNYCSPQDANDLMIKVKRLCEEENVTVLSIAHYNKTMGLVAKDKTSGAKRIVEAHRMAWGFDRVEGDAETTLITPIKKNLLGKAKSYKITTTDRNGVGVIKFLGLTDITADDVIEAREDKSRGNRKELKKAILDVLKDGPLSAGQVCNQLQDMNVSVRTIQRAAEQLVEESKLKKSGNNRNNMTWQLATDVEQATFDEVTR